MTRAMRAERAVFCTASSVPLPRLEFADSKRRFAAEVIGFTRRIEFRSAVRAGAFAHPAANALFLIYQNFTRRAAVNSLDRTNRHTGGLVAVHAAHAEPIDEVGRNIFKALHAFVENARSNLIFFLAGDRTGMAADAFVDIDDDSES